MGSRASRKGIRVNQLTVTPLSEGGACKPEIHTSEVDKCSKIEYNQRVEGVAPLHGRSASPLTTETRLPRSRGRRIVVQETPTIRLSHTLEETSVMTYLNSTDSTSEKQLNIEAVLS